MNKPPVTLTWPCPDCGLLHTVRVTDYAAIQSVTTRKQEVPTKFVSKALSAEEVAEEYRRQTEPPKCESCWNFDRGICLRQPTTSACGYVNAMFCRAEDSGMCGPSGKWFEAKEDDR